MTGMGKSGNLNLTLPDYSRVSPSSIPITDHLSDKGECVQSAITCHLIFLKMSNIIVPAFHS